MADLPTEDDDADCINVASDFGTFSMEDEEEDHFEEEGEDADEDGDSSGIFSELLRPLSKRGLL